MSADELSGILHCIRSVEQANFQVSGGKDCLTVCHNAAVSDAKLKLAQNNPFEINNVFDAFDARQNHPGKFDFADA